MAENAVDVSSYQGANVDWAAEASAGVALGICKATEGTGWTDPTFAGNWAGIKAAKMLRGAYHFAHPGDSVQAEVDHFLSVVERDGQLDASDKLWLDIEANGGLGGAAVPQWGLAFMDLLTQRLGGDPSRCGVYTGRWFIDQTGGPGAWQGLTRWGYWYSAYTATLNAASLAPWSTCVLWQNTSSARMAGVHGVCDASVITNGGYFSAVKVPPTDAGRNEDQPMPLFRRGPQGTPQSAFWVDPTDGGLYTTWQATAGGTDWQPHQLLGGSIPGGGIISIDMNPEAPFETIALCKDRKTYTTWQTSPGSAWAPWTPIG